MTTFVSRSVIANLCVPATALLLLCDACSRPPEPSSEPEVSTDASGPAPFAPVKVPQLSALELGQQRNLEITPGESHSYGVEAGAGEFMHIVVEQRGIDVAATLFDPRGEVLVQSDRAIDDVGLEPLLALAKVSGSYRLVIEAPATGEASGRCVVWIEELHSASDRDRQRAEAARMFFEARIQHEGIQAIEQLHRARDTWHALDDPFWEAECAQRLGREHYRLGEWEEAAGFHEHAAELYRKAGDTRSEAIARNHLGRDYHRLWDIERAIQSYQRALPLRQAADDRRGEALTMLNLAQAFQHQDEVQKALDFYARGLELLPPQDRDLRAIAVHNLGVLHLALGRVEEARRKLNDAERAWAELKSPRRAAALIMLGELHQRLGEVDRAYDYIQRALILRQTADDRRGEGIALSTLARVHQAQGDLDQALELSLKAQDIMSQVRHSYSQATVLRNLGSIYVDRNQPTEAKDYLRQASELFRRVGDRTGEAECLLGVAIAERQEGNLSTALSASQQALAILESVRPKAVRHEHRTSFFATVQEHFESHIDLLMALHRSDNSAGYDAHALIASERARARSFLDLLAEAEAEIRAGAAPDLLTREKALQRRLNAREFRLLRLRKNPRSKPEELAAAQKAVELALGDLEELWGQIRRRDPHYAALTETPIPSLPEIQRQILDEETLLLEYRLGRDQSFLWALTHDSLNSYVLPGRQEIEQLARKAYKLLEVSHRPQARTSSRNALCNLAQRILQPVIPQLAEKRLLVISDGALLYIPFAALPEAARSDECLSAPPLMARHEIIHLPSVSALSILRRDLDDRPSAPFQIAVVADPVFATNDERLTMTLASTPLEEVISPARSVEGFGPRSFSRLPFSEREALAILALVPEHQRYSALGFEASKETVKSGRLAEYQIVHFATHGILDTEQPNLSKMVLSQIDRRGRHRDGFLRTHEIYNLKLRCGLVVLSACQTALGKEVRGEGLVGLTRGFMYAGAARVMVSLWNVDDRSTALLMERFYRSIFEQGQKPAAALRQAQISMWRNAEWAAPFHWAGFVVQGDWR